MKKEIILKTVFLVLFLFSNAFAEYEAEVAYVTNEGEAYKSSCPEVKLERGQKLAAGDAIVLKNKARIRLYFPELRKTSKYAAPATISIAVELKELRHEIVTPDTIGRAQAEFRALIGRYFRPQYDQPAGTRGDEMEEPCGSHSFIPTYRLWPHFVVHSSCKPRNLTLFEVNNGKTGRKVTEIRIHEKQSLVSFPSDLQSLKFNTDYWWTTGNPGESGLICMVRQDEAEWVEDRIGAIHGEAIDNVEACQAIASFLFDEGFWTEALAYIQEGRKRVPDNKTLQQLGAIISAYGPLPAIGRVLLSLPTSPNTSPPVQLKTFVLTPDPACKDTACVELPSFGRYRKEGPFSPEEMNHHVLTTGQILTFSLYNTSPRNYFCYLFNIDMNGKIAAIFPNATFNEESANVREGKHIDLSPKIGLRLNQAGEETIKLLVTQTPIEVSLLIQKRFAGVSKAPREPSPITRIIFNTTNGKNGDLFITDQIWGVCGFNTEIRKHQ